MSLSKWFARKLTIGGTARLFAKMYIHYKKNGANLDDAEIFKLIILFRFKNIKSSKIIDKIQKGQINGLKHLVIETLATEASYFDNTPQTIVMFDEIIEEELLKKGIPKSSI